MKLLNFVAIGAIAVSFNLFAEQTEKETAATLDKNGDGYISIIEATGNEEILRNWSVLDQDFDGKIELGEFSAFESEENPAKTFVPPDVSPEPGAAPF